jgi:hypothetical protein
VFGAAADPPVEFYQVNEVARLASGRVAVLDNGDKVLRVFEPDGSLAFTAGGEGDGPGEFQSPGGLVPLGGDTVLVYDKRHQRFTRFGPEGSYVGDRRLESPALEHADLRQYAPEDVVGDTVLMIPTSWIIPGREESGRFTLQVPMLKYRLDGSFVSEAAEPTTLELEQRESSIGAVTFTRPTRGFAKRGQVYVVDPARYEVRVYPHDDGLARIYRFERPRRPVTDDDVEAYVEDLIESAQAGSGVVRAGGRTPRVAKDAENQIREHFTNAARADSFPSITAARVDAHGDVWVSEYQLPWQEEESNWAVFAADGRWLGTARVPDGFTPFYIGEDSALGIQVDELEVQQVVEYPVRRLDGN